MTAEEKLAKKQRLNLLSLCNRVASAFSLKKISTWQQVYDFTGTPSNPKHGPVTFQELKVYFDGLKKELEDNIAGRGKGDTGTQEPVVQDAPVSLVVQPTSDLGIPPRVVDAPEPETELTAKDDYGLPKGDFKAFLYWFQKKAVKQALDGFLGFDVSVCKTLEDLKREYEKDIHRPTQKHGQLLLAATGTGKTYIAAALLWYLHRIGFHEGRTFGHTLYLYVTRATIVEQTKRVFESQFNLGMKDGIEIINIEQLRSRAGEVWIKEELRIINGKEVREFKWKGVIAPCFILWDESQGLKNDGSLQNLIACAYNEIK